MSANHTPTPWRFTANDTTFQVWGEGEIRVAATSWHGSLRRPYPLKPEANANVELIVAAVNAYHSNQSEIARLREALEGLLAANDAVQLVLCDGPEVPGFDPTALGRAQAKVVEAEHTARKALSENGHG